MGSNVSIAYSNWQNTGQQVLVDKWMADLSIQWKDDEGVDQEWAGTITFPNDLAQVPGAWLKEMLLELSIRAARKKLGVD